MTAPKTILGCALGGGGARGFAHVGVLQVLQEAGLHCTVVSGSSVGAVVGAAYGAGVMDEFVEQARALRLTDLPRLLRPSLAGGWFTGEPILARFTQLIGTRRIESLTIRFAAVATDLQAGEEVAFESGDLETAVRASTSVPGFFSPVPHEGRTLVDGALLDPLPVATARRLGAGCVLAVDLFHDHGPWQTSGGALGALADGARRHLPQWLRDTLGRLSGSDTQADRPRLGTLETMERALVLMQRQATRLRLEKTPADLVLRPAVDQLSLLDYHRVDEAIVAGRRAAEAHLTELEQLLRR